MASQTLYVLLHPLHTLQSRGGVLPEHSSPDTRVILSPQRAEFEPSQTSLSKVSEAESRNHSSGPWQAT